MESQNEDQGWTEGARSAIEQARTGVSEAIGHVPEIAGQARGRAEQVADGLPGALGRARTGASNGVTRLQTMSDSKLRLLAAASVGFGAGLRLAGASRIATLAGFVPASVFGFAILSRPDRPVVIPRPTRP